MSENRRSFYELEYSIKRVIRDFLGFPLAVVKAPCIQLTEYVDESENWNIIDPNLNVNN